MGNAPSEFDEQVARRLSLNEGSANLKTLLAAVDFSPEAVPETATAQNFNIKARQEDEKTGTTLDSQKEVDRETKGDDKNVQTSDVDGKNCVTEIEKTVVKSTTQTKNDIPKVPPTDEKNVLTENTTTMPNLENCPVDDSLDTEVSPAEEKNVLTKTTTTMPNLENCPVDDTLENSTEIKEDKLYLKTEIEKSDVVVNEPEKDAVNVQREINAVQKALNTDGKETKSKVVLEERVSFWGAYSCCRR